MKLARLAALSSLFSLLLAGCPQSTGPTKGPIDRMFDSSYEKFISAADAHKGGCEISLSAR